MNGVDLSRYDNRWYSPGGTRLKRILWYVVNALVFDSWLAPSSALKCKVLRAFGARIGSGVVIKPRVNIKYPWLLSIGDHCWVGEGVWLDNLAMLTIGSHVCISQGAYLLTGNHDYRDKAFGLVVKPITLHDGCWVGAKTIVCPGVVMNAGAVLTGGSVLQRAADAFGIYTGHPAQKTKLRMIDDNAAPPAANPSHIENA